MRMQNLAEGILIIGKYLEGHGRRADADHWSLWVEGPPPADMMVEDAALLKEKGWVYRDDFVQASLLSGPAKRWEYRL